MNEPYDDAAPFPPEWEGSSEREIPDELKELLFRMMPDGLRQKLMENARKSFADALATFATLSLRLGSSSFERVQCSQSKENPLAGGFHAAIHFNINEESIKNAGLTVEDVADVWDIHAQQLADFFESIKRQMVDKGLAHDGEDEHNEWKM